MGTETPAVGAHREQPDSGRPRNPAATKREWYVCLATALVGCTFPILLAQFPPAADLPQHLAQIRLLNELLGFFPASPMIADPIVINWFGPGNLVYVPMWFLSWIFEPVTVGRIILWILIALNVGMLFLTAFRRGLSPWSALLASVFSFNLCVYWGFLGFLLGAPFFLFWVHIVSQLSSTLRWREIFHLALLALLLYGSHSLWFLIAVLWLAFVTLIQRPIFKVLLMRVSAILPVCVLAAVWFPRLSQLRATSGFDLQAHWFGSMLARLNPLWLIDAVLGGLRGPVEPVVLFMVFIWIGLSLGTNRKKLRHLVDRPLLWAALTLLLIVYLGPDKYMNTIYQNSRFAPTAFAFVLLALPAPALYGSLRRILPLATTVVFFTVTAFAWRAFSKSDLAGLRAALDGIEKPGMVLGLDFSKYSEIVKTRPFLQLVGYAQAETGSVPSFSFAEHGSSIVTYTQSRPISWTPGLEWFAERVQAEDFNFFNYVLVVGHDRIHQRFMNKFNLRQLTSQARCRLYATRMGE